MSPFPLLGGFDFGDGAGGVVGSVVEGQVAVGDGVGDAGAEADSGEEGALVRWKGEESRGGGKGLGRGGRGLCGGLGMVKDWYERGLTLHDLLLRRSRGLLLLCHRKAWWILLLRPLLDCCGWSLVVLCGCFVVV